KRGMQMREVMNRHVARITPGTGLRDAAHQMWALNLSLLPVCDGITLVGVLTARDLIVRAAAEGRDPQTCTVSEVMTRDFICAHEEQDAGEALRIMQIHRLPRL